MRRVPIPLVLAATLAAATPAAARPAPLAGLDADVAQAVKDRPATGR